MALQVLESFHESFHDDSQSKLSWAANSTVKVGPKDSWADCCTRLQHYRIGFGPSWWWQSTLVSVWPCRTSQWWMHGARNNAAKCRDGKDGVLQAPLDQDGGNQEDSYWYNWDHALTGCCFQSFHEGLRLALRRVVGHWMGEGNSLFSRLLSLATSCLSSQRFGIFLSCLHRTLASSSLWSALLCGGLDVSLPHSVVAILVSSSYTACYQDATKYIRPAHLLWWSMQKAIPTSLMSSRSTAEQSKDPLWASTPTTKQIGAKVWHTIWLKVLLCIFQQSDCTA